MRPRSGEAGRVDAHMIPFTGRGERARVSADGRRFLFIRAEPESLPTRLDVILNWFPELERKLAAR